MIKTKGKEEAIYAEGVKAFLEKVKNFETKTGPDISSIDNFLADCKILSISSAALRICRSFRSSFNIPDDYQKRVLALEQFYRDSAPSVIKDRRAIFKRMAMGNAETTTGRTIEVAYDLNHGENVMWVPSKGQFGIPDR